MNHHRLIFALAVVLHLLRVDVYPQEVARRDLSAAAKKTMQIVSETEFQPGIVTSNNLDEVYGKIKASLAQKGVTVRLRKSSKREIPQGELRLERTTLKEFMEIFDSWAGWGWIVYEDGSITYFDVQCACCWPRGGVGYHEEQYQAGSPENMRKSTQEQESKPPVKSDSRSTN